MDHARRKVVAWVGRDILPHEADVRAWLRRSMVPASDVDDVLQEAYCRLAGLADVGHIASPRAYFFTVVRSIVIDQMRRARVVRMETVTEIDALNVVQEDPSPERITAARRDLERVRRLIGALPDRCRRIFEMRKIDGLSQREIARRLGVTETIVENDVVRGLKLILKAIADGDRAVPQDRNLVRKDGRARHRESH
jgi:RNA polymerase sigma-70 factor (ECF subfamily)